MDRTLAEPARADGILGRPVCYQRLAVSQDISKGTLPFRETIVLLRVVGGSGLVLRGGDHGKAPERHSKSQAKAEAEGI